MVICELEIIGSPIVLHKLILSLIPPLSHHVALDIPTKSKIAPIPQYTNCSQTRVISPYYYTFMEKVPFGEALI